MRRVMVVLPLPVPPAMPIVMTSLMVPPPVGQFFFPNILPHARGRCNLTFAFFAVKM
jgi:hypothetical protein